MNFLKDVLEFLENKNPAIKTVLEASIQKIMNQLKEGERINGLELLTMLNNIVTVFNLLDDVDWDKIEKKLETQSKEHNDIIENKNFIIPNQKQII